MLSCKLQLVLAKEVTAGLPTFYEAIRHGPHQDLYCEVFSCSIVFAHQHAVSCAIACVQKYRSNSSSMLDEDACIN